jgi:predicted TIM-barrel fold metal-dependent hydrolase
MDLDWMISVDDHVLEPPSTFVDRVPRALREAAPHVVRSDGYDYWVYADKAVPITKMPGVPWAENFAMGGKWAGSPPGDREGTKSKNYDEVNPTAYDPQARAKTMDMDHVIAGMCFPTVVRFAGQVFLETRDHENRLMFLKAYNDWMLDEWAAGAPGRLIPLIVIPLWDPVAAAEEIERCAAKGARAFSFPENPAPLGLPTIHRPDRHWDPVLAAANETGMPLCQHIGSSSRYLGTSTEAHLLVTLAWAPMCNISGALTDWMLNDAFFRFPDLKVVLSEGNIGWIPYLLGHIAMKYERAAKYRHFKITEEGGPIDFEQVYRDHVYGCVIEDKFGMRNLDIIGYDNVMIESDFPHLDTRWPHSLDWALEQAASLTPEQKYKVLRGNAERLFNFQPANPPDIELGDLEARRDHALSTIVTSSAFDVDGVLAAQQAELAQVGGRTLNGAPMEANADGMAIMRPHN